MIKNSFFNNTFLGFWLLILTLMVYAIILIGGLTRLTESGLSMVDWRPLMGTIPPITPEDWNDVFNQYKKTPEFMILNNNMLLEEFKYIFWWEYSHRLFARLIGIVFIIPFIYFLIKKSFTKKQIIQLTVVFIFAIIQAVVGWWMVKSGLTDDPYVSQYRLSFHLTNAIIILCILLWLTLENFFPKQNNFKLDTSVILITISLFLCLITIISGSFVSATDAGKSYNTFPLMDGKLIPEGYLIYENFFINFFENTIAIQFNHRWLAIFSFIWTIAIIVYILKNKISYSQKITCLIIFFLITLQIFLGIFTLIYNVPVILASIHQANATLLLCSLLTSLYFFSNR